MDSANNSALSEAFVLLEKYRNDLGESIKTRIDSLSEDLREHKDETKNQFRRQEDHNEKTNGRIAEVREAMVQSDASIASVAKDIKDILSKIAQGKIDGRVLAYFVVSSILTVGSLGVAILSYLKSP